MTGQPDIRFAFVRPVTRKAIVRVLLVGFSLVILLLVAAGFVGVRNLSAIRRTAEEILAGQARTGELLDEVLRQQRAINTIYASFTRPPDLLDREETLEQLQASDNDIEKIATTVQGQPGEELWKELFDAASVFSREARRILQENDRAPAATAELLASHQRVVALVDRMIDASSTRSVRLSRQLEDFSSRMLREAAFLLGGGLLLALGCAFFTLRLTGTLIRQLEWQTAELGRVSWQLLENQETTARRFSHELHDELGQSLTAIKANLASMLERSNGARERVTDCLHLVDDAITNVRAMSQLLRPTILDDFGLTAGIKWLCDGFQQRTGLEVKFDSDVKDRLVDETETHLFRIAQEAMTNIARHADAKHVAVSLTRDNGSVALRIRDDGHGIQASDAQNKAGLGMVGMRARARSAGGELNVTTDRGTGVLIEAIFPYQARQE